MVEKQRFKVDVQFPVLVNDQFVGTIGMKTDEEGNIKPFADMADTRLTTEITVDKQGRITIKQY